MRGGGVAPRVADVSGERAACRLRTPRLGVGRVGLLRGDSNHDAWFPYPSEDFEYARGICADCPIRQACGEFAAETGQSGVWGGHEFDRGRMIRE